MNKSLLILSILTAVIGVIGFSIDFIATSFLRVLFLITADVLVILCISKFLFNNSKAKGIKQRVHYR